MRIAPLLLGLAAVLTPLRAQEGPAVSTDAPAADGAAAGESPRLKVGVDAALAGIMPELAQAWADATEGAPVVEMELTNSGTLDGFLAKGHPWDLVVVAGREDAAALTSAGRLRSGGQKIIAQARLGVLGKNALIEDEMLDWYDLVQQEWTAVVIGDPKLTASGPAAVELMKKRGVYGMASKNLRTVTNTPEGLKQLRRDQAEAIIAFEPELRGQVIPGFRSFPVDPKLNPPVFFTAALTAQCANPALAESFLAFLVSPAAEKLWRQHGYLE